MISSLVISFFLLVIFGWNQLYLNMLVIDLASLHMFFDFLMSASAKVFCCLVFMVSCAILGYCSAYMSGEAHKIRFTLLLLLFVFSMAILIMSNSTSSLILGWDGLGLSSYFLVVYYLNKSSNLSGVITVISNRIGDGFIILMLVLLISDLMDWVYPCVFTTSMSLLMGGLILSSAITKSAMIPYSVWLPEAMSAPTPISALVHSSTLVTAGVWLCYQLSFVLSPLVYSCMSILSVMTLMASSVSAMISQDLKKVVALSTLSQLSLMFVTLSLGLKSLALFHLLSHAGFKSGLFMAVGVILHSSLGSQSARMKMFVNSTWVSLSVCGVCLFALMGAPFMSAYYSKEMIVLKVSLSHISMSLVLLLLISLGLTMGYSIRFFISLLSSSVNKVSMKAEDLTMSSFMVLNVTLSLLFGFLANSGSQVINWSMGTMSVVVGISTVLVLMQIILYITQAPLLKDPKSSNSLIQFVYLKGVSVTMIAMVMGAQGSYSRLVWDKGWTEEVTSKGVPHMTLMLSSYTQTLISGRLLGLITFILILMIFMFPL